MSLQLIVTHDLTEGFDEFRREPRLLVGKRGEAI